MNDVTPPSVSSIIEATKNREKFSGHGKALGAAGHRVSSFDPENYVDLHHPGNQVFINPREEGGQFSSIVIGGAWDNVVKPEKPGFFQSFFKKPDQPRGVDIDLGCLYEMKNGQRGCIQAFGQKFGSLNTPPFIQLSGDEQHGDRPGFDEFITINAAHWHEIKRVLVYVYIYQGVASWREVNPKIILDVPGEKDLVVSLDVFDDVLDLCAVGGLENVDGGIKLTNYTEYFPGHAEMDRAFGFGLNWRDGEKR